jgi:uroporphyrinogen-III decarboxylase
MCATGASGISLDADVDLPRLAAQVPDDVVILGNVHPVHEITPGNPTGIRSATHELRAKMTAVPNFVLSTGCDVPGEAPTENVKALIDAARER